MAIFCVPWEKKSFRRNFEQMVPSAVSCGPSTTNTIIIVFTNFQTRGDTLLLCEIGEGKGGANTLTALTPHGVITETINVGSTQEVGRSRSEGGGFRRGKNPFHFMFDEKPSSKMLGEVAGKDNFVPVQKPNLAVHIHLPICQ